MADSADVLQAKEERPESALSSQSSWSDYRLQWLFDPNRYDHLPIEEQLQFFAQRDLRKVKIYKIATSIWGTRDKRKRKIIAPPMYNHEKSDSAKPMKLAPLMTTELKPQAPPPVLPTKEEVALQNEKEQLESYNKWVADRKTFRNDLENMGLNEDWLRKKTNKTLLEKRVLQKMIADRKPKKESPPPPVQEPIEAILPDESPVVKRPSPLAIQIIERFLHEKKIRLLDLFASVDKDKNWKLTREEFTLALQKAKIPISEVLLEDLILALDTDLNNELDYRELAKGMGLWKIEKRESKRKLVSNPAVMSSPSKYSQLSGFETPECQSSLSGIQSVTQLQQQCSQQSQPQTSEGPAPERDGSSGGGGRTASPTRVKSALSNISSTSSHLEPPPPDLRPEQRLESSEEAMVDLRKRDREALARFRGKQSRASSANNEETPASGKTVIKTGNQPIDDHSRPSTLGGEAADMVDKFRQLKLREYNEIVKLCRDNSVVLTEDLLSRVLLYPSDKVHGQLRRSLRQPLEQLLPSTFADPPKRPRTPVEERVKTEKVKLSKSGRRLVDSRHAYPPRSQVAASPTKMHLSTGRATVRRQVDCWMTFEEYESLTRQFATRYKQQGSRVDENAFWPGQLLHKMRLCMPGMEEVKAGAVFRKVAKEKKVYPGNNNDLLNWTTNDSGYLQEGIMDTYHNKYI